VREKEIQKILGMNKFIKEVYTPNLERLEQSFMDDTRLSNVIYHCFYCGKMLPEYLMIPNSMIFGNRIAPEYFRCCADCFDYYNLGLALK